MTASSHFEVDFLARGAGGEADASDPAVAERELRALAEAGNQHPQARKRLLTLTRDGAPASTPADVAVQPAYEWLPAAPI